MPTTDWNRRWVDEMNNQLGEQHGYYGAHWGDPNPTAVFPAWMRKRLPKVWLLRLLTIRPLEEWLLARQPEISMKANDGKYTPALHRVYSHFLRPHVQSNHTILEIGPGGGRWTEYMLHAQHLIMVELNPEFFDYLRQRFAAQIDKFRFYQTRDYELDGITSESVDFVFSFGTFVHIDPDGISQYLNNLARVMKPGAKGVIQFADKTKVMAQEKPGFSDMTPDKFRAMLPANLRVIEMNTDLLPHSSIALFEKTR
ncbi:MAG: class I SAM-dependent methyltransferase [Anaerolineae bacterium]|jgi:phospholipid N-methyltransferase|nr:class I SAM-dependent methyltransferase [Anaerolineae bacterium]